MRILPYIVTFVLAISSYNVTALPSKNTQQAAQDPSSIPVEAFFKNATFNDMRISKNGELIAALYDTGNSNTLVIMDVNLTKIHSKINFGDYKYINGVVWLTDERFMVSYHKRVGYLDNRTSNSIWVAYDIDGENGRQLTVPQRAYYDVISTLPNKPDKILVGKRFVYGMMTGNYFQYEGEKLFEIDIHTGKEKYLAIEAEDASSYVADTNGNARAARILTKENRDAGIESGEFLFELALKRTPNSKWENIALPIFGTPENAARVGLLGFNHDNTILYMTSDINSKLANIYSVNIQSLETKLVHEENVSEISGLGRFYHRGLEAVSISSDYNNLIFLSEESEMKKVITQLYASLGVDPKTTDIRISSYTDDGNQLIVRLSSDRDPGVFYLFNRGLDGSKPEIRFLDTANDMIDPELMASMTPFSFTSRDGKTIHGYYVLPTTGEGPFPMVQLVHGGPHGIREYWGWDREAQFLASRGYAVVKVNFRGSGGYGYDFLRAGHKQWGGKMINDMTDGTMWMVEQGFADKDKLCIYGGSYGGYGTLQSLVREPDLYKCGIGYVGVYSLLEMKESGDIPRGESGRNYLDRVLGVNEERLAKYSPALNVDKIKAELFIAHGSEDVRVPMEQYEVLSENLKKIGKPYISMIREEGHGYSKPENRYDFYSTMESFLAENLK
jgi:dienelactone hydrolase